MYHHLDFGKSILGIAFCFLSIVTLAQDQSKYDVSMARKEIVLLNKEIRQLQAQFKEERPKIQDEDWVESKLENMFKVSFEMRQKVVDNLKKKPWTDEVKKAYLLYYYNYDADINSPKEFGVLQSIDFFNNEDLKNLLYSNKDIRKRGWLSYKDFSKQTEALAWYIWAHGIFYDAPTHHAFFPSIDQLMERGKALSAGKVYYKLYGTKNNKPPGKAFADFDFLIHDLEMEVYLHKQYQNWSELNAAELKMEKNTLVD